MSLSSFAVGAGVTSREDSWYYHILYGCEGQSHQSVSAVPRMQSSYQQHSPATGTAGLRSAPQVQHVRILLNTQFIFN